MSKPMASERPSTCDVTNPGTVRGTKLMVSCKVEMSWVILTAS